MGGVWFAEEEDPLLWRTKFPKRIQRGLVSSSNPKGDLTNSDFELAGVIGKQDIVTQAWDIREVTVAVLTDNTPAISRSRKCSITTKDAADYLLRLSSLNQHHHRYLITFDHINGPANAMADDCSRLWRLND
jgi:hypothetical protein